MARDSIIADSRAATLGFILFLVTSQITFCFCAPLNSWIDNPCHDRPERQTRHSRDANRSELWKKQFRLAQSKFKHDLLPKIKHQYKDIPDLIFNNKNCPSIYPPPKMRDQTPQNYYEAIREYAIILYENANFKDLPKTVNFDYDNRRVMFEDAANITKGILCEVYDLIPEDKKWKKPVKPYVVKSPYEVTDMMTEDYTILRCFGRFLTMAQKKINGKNKGKKGKRGKKNSKVRNQRKHNNKRKSNTAS